jgi:electron transfer flavoprotein beta subunit
LVVAGLPSDNQGFSLTGVFLAERLGLPQATVIMQIDVESDRLRVKREREGRWSQRLKLLLPAVLTIQSDFDDHPSRCREK